MNGNGSKPGGYLPAFGVAPTGAPHVVSTSGPGSAGDGSRGGEAPAYWKGSRAHRADQRDHADGDQEQQQQAAEALGESKVGKERREAKPGRDAGERAQP